MHIKAKHDTMTMLLPEKVKRLYKSFGQQKQMGLPSKDIDKPHFFLQRQFAGDQDLLVVFNTKRCSYQCYFCELPTKSSKTWISGDHILAQFDYVMTEMKHSLSVLTRVTLSNEGSILDTKTFSHDALVTIALAVNELRLVGRLVLETRLEYVQAKVLDEIKQAVPKRVIDILTGFETLDRHIRDDILFKKESLDLFLSGLDRVAEAGAELTSYVLYKPSPFMGDVEAYQEAQISIDYLYNQCKKRNIPLSIRLNPMYTASSSRWAQLARQTSNYKPPRLTDVMRLAQQVRKAGIGVYIGLSSEGLDEPGGTYMAREDFSPALIKPVKLFNNRKISFFEGYL